MAAIRTAILYLALIAVGALLATLYLSPSDDGSDGDTTSKRPSVVAGSNATEHKADVEPDTTGGKAGADSTTLRLEGQEVAGAASSEESFLSFEQFMTLPGARAEAYVMPEGLLVPRRVEEFSSPEKFDSFASTLERNADADGQQQSSELLQKFYAAEEMSNGAITAHVACATAVCTATFQSPDAAAINGYMAALPLNQDIPMYTTMEMPAENLNGLEVRRVIFTTDPDANFVEFEYSE